MSSQDIPVIGLDGAKLATLVEFDPPGV